MERFARKTGFDKFTYVLRVNAPSLAPTQFVLSGYPKEWVDRYMDRGYFNVHPVVDHCQGSAPPVIWDDRTLDDGKAVEFWEEARSFGLRAGLSFAVHEQPGCVGIFSL